MCRNGSPIIRERLYNDARAWTPNSVLSHKCYYLWETTAATGDPGNPGSGRPQQLGDQIWETTAATGDPGNPGSSVNQKYPPIPIDPDTFFFFILQLSPNKCEGVCGQCAVCIAACALVCISLLWAHFGEKSKHENKDPLTSHLHKRGGGGRHFGFIGMQSNP